jgi:hypothetical protein
MFRVSNWEIRVINCANSRNGDVRKNKAPLNSHKM